MKAKINNLLAVVLLLPMLVGCGGTKETTTTTTSSSDSEYDTYIYEFRDASVPPEYHRSYQITVTPDAITKWVNSYGQTISKEKKPLAKGDFEAVVAAFKATKIKNCKLDADTRGCTGGTGEGISCMKDEVEKFNGRLSHCGSQTSGNLCGDLPTFLGLLNSLLEAE